LALQHIYW